MTALREQVLDWFLRRQREDWSSDDAQALADWLDADPSHQTAYDRFRQHWSALDSLPAETVARLRSGSPGATSASDQGAAHDSAVQPAATPRVMRSVVAQPVGTQPVGDAVPGYTASCAQTGTSPPCLLLVHPALAFRRHRHGIPGHRIDCGCPGLATPAAAHSC